MRVFLWTPGERFCFDRTSRHITPHQSTARTKPNEPPSTHTHTDGWEVPRQTWVFDSLPGAVHRDRAIGEHSVAQVIETLARVPMPQPTKEGLAHRLVHEDRIPAFIAHWLMTSLQRHPGHGVAGGHHTPGGYAWAFDLPVVQQLFQAYTQECFYDTLASPFLSADSHRLDFIRAGKNAAWTPDVLAHFDALRAKGRCVWVGVNGRCCTCRALLSSALLIHTYLHTHSTNVHLHTLPDAGHWVHVDDLPGVLSLMAPTFAPPPPPPPSYSEAKQQ